MTWPQKGTRKITVGGVAYLWHYSGHCPLCTGAVITVGMDGAPYVLHIDPFPWNFELKPSSIVEAIAWASGEGWSPQKGPTRAMALDDETNEFKWLPQGRRHLACVK